MTDEHRYLDALVSGYLTSPLPLRVAGQVDVNAGMVMSPQGRWMAEAFEGYERALPDGTCTTYFDSVGVLTIGFGTTNLSGNHQKISQGDVWTRAQADAAFDDDMIGFGNDVRRYFPNFPLKQYQFDALDDMDFNTGALGRSSIPAKIKAGNIDAAMATLLQYNHAGGQVLPGLTRRRHAERLMFLGMVDDALVLAGAHRDTRMAMSKATTAPCGEI